MPRLHGCYQLLIPTLLSVSSFAFAQTETQTNIHSKQLDTVVVTSTQEQKSLRDLAESVGVLSQNDINTISPSHPSELLNRTPGVYINNLGGESHMTAIRQPITTGGVYLFLENGIPTRPTGFFNHNGLYEVNIPQAQRLEVTKGPGSALYGSDAMGGIINSISADIPDVASNEVTAEFGSYQWQRLLLSAGRPISASTGVAVQANLTQNDSFREHAEYTRSSLTAQANHKTSANTQWNTHISYNEIDQSGVSDLSLEDYRNNPESNHYQGDVGGRTVSALRVSSRFNHSLNEKQLLTVTPFYRKNTSTMMPSWMVSYDPNERETQFESFGLLSKWRLKHNQTQWIVGLDIDHTPSSYEERIVTVEESNGTYTDFTDTGNLSYDFSATQTSISPYAQWEQQFNAQFVTHLGVRYDRFEVDYTNHLESPVDTRHLTPESQTLSYDHLSPKAGVVWQVNQNHDVYLNYRHGFRAPSVSTLFRSGSSQGTTELDAIKTDSFELGMRGLLTQGFTYEAAVYHMKKFDDIVSVINDNNDRVSVNAGETLHKGIELGLAGAFTQTLSMNASFSMTQQEYGDFNYTYFCFSCSPKQQVINFDGNQVGKAPKTLGNLALRYEPLSWRNMLFEIEMEHVGAYYTDETNTSDYKGHQLLNLRSQFDAHPQVQVYGRVQNIMDKRYSTYTSNQVGSDEIRYRPGSPLTLVAGIRAQF